MHTKLTAPQLEILRGSPAIHNEFVQKVKILDHRLQKNGMNYRRDWDLMNDRQRMIFSDNLFLTSECANTLDDYVEGAVSSCGCPDTEEELHHHSPVLMDEIERQREMSPNLNVKVAANESFDKQIDQMLSVILESEDIWNPFSDTLAEKLEHLNISYLISQKTWQKLSVHFLVVGLLRFITLLKAWGFMGMRSLSRS